MSEAKAINYWALAPFGRVGHALGWRWVFFFTFPIPFHPWLARALPLLVAGWIAWLALRPGPLAWTPPLWAALILAVPLSVPIFQWIMFAFRLHLLQAVMLPSALLLLGVAAWRGDLALRLSAIPLLYFAAIAAAVIAGRSRIRAWRAANDEVEARAVDEGRLPPLLVRGNRARDVADQLLERLSLPALHYESQGIDKQVLRIDSPELIEWLGQVQAMRLDLFEMPERYKSAHRHIHLRAEPPAAPCILEPAEAAARTWLIQGDVAALRASPSDHPPLTYWYGRPAPLSWLGGFYFFLRLRLGSNASIGPEVGFLPAAPQPIGEHGDEQGAAFALVSALMEPGAPPPPFADSEAVRTRVQALLDQRLAPELSALDRLIAKPDAWLERRLDTLIRLPDLYADRAEELVAAFRTARDARHRPATILLARLIAALPAPAFQRVGEALLAVLNSKLLAGRVRPNPADKDAQPPAFDGFRLLVHVPDLYARLSELGEPARPVLTGLLKLLPHIEALQKAMAALDAAARPSAAGD